MPSNSEALVQGNSGSKEVLTTPSMAKKVEPTGKTFDINTTLKILTATLEDAATVAELKKQQPESKIVDIYESQASRIRSS